MCNVWRYAFAVAFVAAIAYFGTVQVVRLLIYTGGL